MTQLVGETALEEVSWFLFNDIIVEAQELHSGVSEDDQRFQCRKVFSLSDIEITSMEEMGAKLTGELPSRYVLITSVVVVVVVVVVVLCSSSSSSSSFPSLFLLLLFLSLSLTFWLSCSFCLFCIRFFVCVPYI
jgi:hypothetical protein